MTRKTYSFNSFNNHCADGIFQSLIDCAGQNKHPFFVCIGSDLVLGDSLGPLVGTLLRKKNIQTFVYGTLNYPITAKEVDYAGKYLKQMHPGSISVAIDAAVGEPDDVGLIRVANKGLKPGLGVDKNLAMIGDVSIIAVVASKSLQNQNLFNLTRLNLVYKMAEQIADGIEKYISFITSKSKNSINFFGA